LADRQNPGWLGPRGSQNEVCDLVQAPSLHLRISYEGGLQWDSWYPINCVPSNVASLYRGCRALGLRMLGPPPWKNLPEEEVRRRAKKYGPPRENQ
jgi:hypothetical protein